MGGLGFNFFTIQISYCGWLSTYGKERQSFLRICRPKFPKETWLPVWQIGSIFWGSCVARENWPSSRRTMCFPRQASCPSSLGKHGCLRQMGSSLKRTMSFLGQMGPSSFENHPFALGNTLFLREFEPKTWFSGQLG
jgi:hypothetical protein